GSVVQATSSAGIVSLNREYDSWGNLLQGGTVGGYAFTGREGDSEIGLQYSRARYAPSIGRFLSRDPAGLKGGPNAYAYVGNGPENRTDPLGLEPIKPPEAAYYICCYRHQRYQFVGGQSHCRISAFESVPSSTKRFTLKM